MMNDCCWGMGIWMMLGGIVIVILLLLLIVWLVKRTGK